MAILYQPPLQKTNVQKENAQKAISALLSVLLGYVPVPVFVIFKIPYE